MLILEIVFGYLAINTMYLWAKGKKLWTNLTVHLDKLDAHGKVRIKVQLVIIKFMTMAYFTYMPRYIVGYIRGYIHGRKARKRKK